MSVVTERAIDTALARIDRNHEVSKMNRTVLAELRLRKLIYTVWNDRSGKTHAHLTQKGREALERTT